MSRFMFQHIFVPQVYGLHSIQHFSFKSIAFGKSSDLKVGNIKMHGIGTKPTRGSRPSDRAPDCPKNSHGDRRQSKVHLRDNSIKFAHSEGLPFAIRVHLTYL